MSARRRRRSIVPPVWLSGALVAASVIFLAFTAASRLLPTIGETRTESASEGRLTAIRDLGRLETLSYVHKTVFPHAFYIPDVTYDSLLRADETGLDPRQTTHLGAASIAWDTELALSRRERGFVVVTTTFVFGYDVETIDVRAHEERIVVSLPPAQTLSITVEDVDSTSYLYGPITIDAEEWRLISGFVRERVARSPAVDRYRERARDNAIEVFRSVFATDDRELVFDAGDHLSSAD
jgi:hypothetical protein